MAAADNGVPSMNDEFYRAFEDRHRGTRDLIIARLAVYRPFIAPLKAIYPAGSALDLGCGRGEWLELLLKEGFSPLGIDRDAGMLRECLDRHLPAQRGDATAYLASVADDSQAVVTAFHVVEHLPFDQLRALVSEALRVLKPGGLLIMETPNPENILVATSNFYLDPTHMRPLPPQLLSFLPEYYGFARTKILRLQELTEHAAGASPTLYDVLTGASPDYAVIAQKTAPEETLALFDEPFEREYGLSFDTLAERYDASMGSRVAQVEARAIQAEAKAAESDTRAARSEADLQQALRNAHEWQAQIQAVHDSLSWKITKPVRALGQIAGRPSIFFDALSASVGKLRSFAYSPISIAVRQAGDYAKRSPVFKQWALKLLRGCPGLQQKLYRVYLEGQYRNEPQPSNWSQASPERLERLLLATPDGRTGPDPHSAPKGVNADRRTPLESHFRTYQEQP